MGAPPLEDRDARLVELVPPDGSTVGNITLIRKLEWAESTYWSVRNRLLDRGVLELGKGKGGSVRRASKTAPILEEAIDTKQPLEAMVEVDYPNEAALYEPMAKVISASWVADAGFDSQIIQLTAQTGGRANGKWSRPDIAVAGVSIYPYVPGRHFDVVTFEIKSSDRFDVTCVYEALAHRRAATKSYVLLHVPQVRKEDLDVLLVEVCAESKRHGIGVLTAETPDDYSTWTEVVEPTRGNPDPRRLNEFLAQQFTQEQREEIVKWFR